MLRGSKKLRLQIQREKAEHFLSTYFEVALFVQGPDSTQREKFSVASGFHSALTHSCRRSLSVLLHFLLSTISTPLSAAFTLRLSIILSHLAAHPPSLYPSCEMRDARWSVGVEDGMSGYKELTIMMAMTIDYPSPPLHPVLHPNHPSLSLSHSHLIPVRSHLLICHALFPSAPSLLFHQHPDSFRVNPTCRLESPACRRAPFGCIFPPAASPSTSSTAPDGGRGGSAQRPSDACVIAAAWDHRVRVYAMRAEAEGDITLAAFREVRWGLRRARVGLVMNRGRLAGEDGTLCKLAFVY